LSDALGVSDLKQIDSPDGKVVFHTNKGMSAEELKEFAQRAGASLQKSRFGDKDTKDISAADFYLSVMLMLHDVARRNPRTDREKVYSQHIRSIWARMANARIIDLGAKQFMDLYHEIDVYCTEQLIGEEWRPAGAPVSPTFDPSSYASTLNKEGKYIPLDTEHLPFENTFFMPGPGEMSFSATQSLGRYGLEKPVALAGFLVSHDGLVSEVGVAYELDDEGRARIHTLVENVRKLANSDQWADPATLVPWIVPALIAYVNEYRKFIVERPPNFDLKQKFKKAGAALKKRKPVPMPYYTVYLKSEKIIETWDTMVRKAKPGKSFEYGHRFDVRGHERCYIRRGELPLDDKERKKLVARGYTVYTVNPMTREDMYRLTERGLRPKSRNEWLGIKVKWIDADVRPHRPDLPYVPAVRKPSKKDRPEMKRTG
jgi:hypothetical protein